MIKNGLSFSQLLNVVFSIVLVCSGIIVYQYGNFGGVSFEELHSRYLAREEIKFTDLSPKTQERYIDKEQTIEQSKDANLFENEYLDEKGNPIPESEVTTKDMRKMVTKLQKTLLFLQHDNLLISSEKSELLKKLEEQAIEKETEQNAILSKNLEKINEAEQQHYKNISDLTMKINELQKENVIMAQRSNIEANTLKSEIENLKAKAIEENEKKRQEIKSAREDEQSRLVDYKDRIKLLSDQVALLNDQMNANSETTKNAFNRKSEEISKLKEELGLANREKNDLLTKHAQTLVEIERKHNEEIAKYTQTMESLKTDTQKLISKNREDMNAKEEENLKKVAIGEEKIKALQVDLSSSKKHIDALILENEKDFNKFRTYLEDEKKLNKELTLNQKKLEENSQTSEKSFNASILKLNETIAKKESAIKALEDKIIVLKNERQNFDVEVKKKIEENDQIHNKNYKIFNEKIASFESSKRSMLEKLDKQLGEYKEASKENYDKMQYHTNELTRVNNELKSKNEIKEKEAQELKLMLASVKNEIQKSKEAEELKLTQLRNSFEELKISTKNKESEYLSKIALLEKDAKTKESELGLAKKEDIQKIASLEKELKSRAIELQAIQDETLRKEENLKSLHVKEKEAQSVLILKASKEAEELKNKLALIEKNRVSEDAKLVGLKDELRRKEIEYLDNIKSFEKENKRKEVQILAIKEESKKTEQTKMQQDEMSSKFKDEFKQRELGYLDTIKILNAKVKTLETSTPKVATPIIPSSVKETKAEKLTALDSVTCIDMGTGVNAVSPICQQNVKAFLAKYDNTYFFEVAPIVDNGGFASLKLIKSKKVGVEDTEIDRISGLANIGLGKARAKAGGDLIISTLGESAKISYALSNIEQDKARGFQIKVYR